MSDEAFKVGDRARVVKDNAVPEYVGATGTVVELHDDGDGLDFEVRFDESVNREGRGPSTYDYFAADELVGVVVIEGVAHYDEVGHIDFMRVGDVLIEMNGTTNIASGDHVRITIERTRKEAK